MIEYGPDQEEYDHLMWLAKHAEALGQALSQEDRSVKVVTKDIIALHNESP